MVVCDVGWDKVAIELGRVNLLLGWVGLNGCREDVVKWMWGRVRYSGGGVEWIRWVWGKWGRWVEWWGWLGLSEELVG